MAANPPPAAPQRHVTLYGDAFKLFNSRDSEIIIGGGAGCVAPETRLYDPVTGESPRIADLERLGIAPTVMTLFGAAQASVPFCKGTARLYEVSLASGRRFLATADHRVLTPKGWTFVAAVEAGESLLVSERAPRASSSAHSPLTCPPGGPRWTSTGQDWTGGCSACPRPCGGQPLGGSGGDPVLSPSPVGVPGCCRADRCPGDPASTEGHTRPCRSSVRPSTPDYFRLPGGTGCVPVRGAARTLQPSSRSSRSVARSLPATPLLLTTGEPSRCAGNTFRLGHQTGGRRSVSDRFALARSCSRPVPPFSGCAAFSGTLPGLAPAAPSSDACNPSSWIASFNPHCTAWWDTVSNVRYVRTGEYFDLHVPFFEHYLAEGVWHHNTGKSVGALLKMHYWAETCPGMRGLLVRKTRASLTQSTMVTWEKDVLGGRHPCMGANPDRTRENRPSYKYPNKSEVVLVGLDKETKVLSAQYDLIFVEEAIELTESEWETLLTRNRNYVMPFNQVYGATNPGPPNHWIKRRERAGLLKLLHSRHEDNPAYYDHATSQWTRIGAEYIKKLESTTGVMRERMRYGRWVQAEGAVYDNWDERIHVVDRFDPPWHWPRYWGIDFGWHDPFVCGVYARDPDGRLYLYREVYRSQRLVEDHARDLLRLHEAEASMWAAREGTTLDNMLSLMRPRAVVCDHDGEGRATLEKYLQMATVPAYKVRFIKAGIEAVKARLTVQGDGKPRFFYMRNSLVERDEHLHDAKRPTSFLEEVSSYSWNPEKDMPIDDNNHFCDQLRYIIGHLDVRGEWHAPSSLSSSSPDAPFPPTPKGVGTLETIVGAGLRGGGVEAVTGRTSSRGMRLFGN